MNRRDVAREIERLLHEVTPSCTPIPNKPEYLHAVGRKNEWHFGLVELRHLMDLLYGGPPQTPDEQVRGREEWKRHQSERRDKHGQ